MEALWIRSELEFVADGEDCEVAYRHDQQSDENKTRTPLTDRSSAWESFAERVRHDLVSRIPGLFEHEEYGRFFREGVTGLEEMWAEWDSWT